MFGRHTSTTTDPDGTAAGERGERYVSSPDGTRTETTPGNDEDTATLRRPDEVDDDRTGRSAGEPMVTERAAEQREANAAADEAANDRTETYPAAEPVTEPVSEPVADTKRWAHVSGMATLSLIVGTLAVAATLTGLLAPLGFAAGVLAILIGIIALYAVRRPGVTGHTLVGVGVLFGLVAIVLSVLAMNDSLSWLSSKTDEIATVHNWLNDHIHWLRRW
jgi:hypothetical protein